MALESPNLPDERDRNVGSVDFADSELPPLDDEGEPDVEENEDGSATVKFDEDAPERPLSSGDFLENLAEILPEEELNRISSLMCDAFDRDKEARKKRDEQYAEGIRRTGLGNDAPGGADFDGASRAVHPVLMEGCIEFAARSMKELMPPKGPVKTQIIGEQTEAKLLKAERKRTYMNWQLTKQIREFRSELEQTVTQVPLGGSQYLKVWHDDRVERPRVEFVAVDSMLIPFAAADFDCAERKTHMQHLTEQTLKSRVSSGLYRDVQIGSPTTIDETDASIASDKVEGKEDTGWNEDGLRLVYESYCELEVKGDPRSKGAQRGYILTIDESSGKVLALYRNWDENDKKKCPTTLDWVVEFGFVPWRGAYKIGLFHIIGGLSAALTGALRALLDSAHISNTPSGLLMSHARTSGENIKASPTELVRITAPPNVDDIRKLAMPFPFSGPSDTLFRLMDWLTTQAKSVVSTANEAIKDAGSDMPVGTTLALIEQGSITFSSVHARLHASQARVLAILHRINGVYLDDEVTVEELGELVVKRSDFEGPMDVMPVSDPNIFSEAQRYAQNQAAMQMAEKFPQEFKLGPLIRRALMLMNYPAPEEVLNAPSEAKELDALSENVAASQPESQLKAFPVQDHLGHIKAHVHFMVSPIFCANPMMAMPALPKLLAHVKDHLLDLYKDHVRAASQIARFQLYSKEADALVQGAAFADRELAKELAPIMPLLQQAQQLAQKLMPHPPGDPRSAAQMKINSDKIAAQAVEGDKNRQLTVQLAQQDAQSEQAENQQENELEINRQSAENARSSQEMDVARENAALADRQETARNELASNTAQMKEMMALIRDLLNANAQVMMAEVKAGREADAAAMQQDFAGYQAAVDKQFEGLKTLLGHGVTLSEGEAQREHDLEATRIAAAAKPAAGSSS